MRVSTGAFRSGQRIVGFLRRAGQGGGVRDEFSQAKSSLTPLRFANAKAALRPRKKTAPATRGRRRASRGGLLLLRFLRLLRFTGRGRCRGLSRAGIGRLHEV